MFFCEYVISIGILIDVKYALSILSKNELVKSHSLAPTSVKIDLFFSEALIYYAMTVLFHCFNR